MTSPAAAFTAALALLIALVAPDDGMAQRRGPPARNAQSLLGTLSQNAPNPVKSETSIPFTVGDHPKCTDGDREYSVTITVLNILAQPTSAPALQRAGDGAGGPPVSKLRLRCGAYVAQWHGSAGSRKDPAPGAYRYTLEVDGRAVATRTMTVAKQ